MFFNVLSESRNGCEKRLKSEKILTVFFHLLAFLRSRRVLDVYFIFPLFF